MSIVWPTLGSRMAKEQSRAANYMSCVYDKPVQDSQCYMQVYQSYLHYQQTDSKN